MSLQKQQDFLARLFTDEGLRQSFLADSSKIGAENDLNDDEINDLKIILPNQIEFFAESLYWKRLRETEKFLPLVKKYLGNEFSTFFKDFSQNYNPQSIKKHLEDAVEFCKFLQNIQQISNQNKNIAKFEQAKLEFFGYGKRIIVCRFNEGLPKKILLNAQSETNKSFKVAIWLKIGKKQLQYFW